MIYCKAPFRISLLGGGSDHPNFIDKHGYGLVLTAAINKYAYVGVKELMPFFPYKTRLTYSEVECVNHWYDIKHRVFKYCLSYENLQNDPVEINYTADLPGSIGLGTSSTMIVCMLEALRQFHHSRGYQDKQFLWKSAFHVENVLMQETVGYQDYLPAIYGWTQGYKITHGKLTFLPLHSKIEDIVNNCGLLLYLGKTRNSSEVLSQYVKELPDSDAQLQIRKLAEEGMSSSSVSHLGCLLRDSWELKKTLSPNVSTPQVDEVIETCVANGAYGAKLCGSGGGGCVFVLARADRLYNIVQATKELGAIQIPFEVAPRGVGRIL
jgi:D-glycero-alpha-D-manno-heptose-7-phosphate kinase